MDDTAAADTPTRRTLEVELPLPGAFVAFGARADVDEALDAAAEDHRADVDDALVSSSAPALTHLDPSSVQALDAPARPRDVVVADAVSRLAVELSGQVGLWALPVCRPRDVTRRRATLRVTDVDLVLPPVGPVWLRTDELVDAMDAALVAADAPRGDGEDFETVTLNRDVVRHKVRTVRTPAPNSATWVARDADTGEVVARDARAPEVRRAAMERARTADAAPMRIEMYRETRRAGDVPQVVIERYVASRRATLRVSLVTPRDPGAEKLAGWVLFGNAPT